MLDAVHHLGGSRSILFIARTLNELEGYDSTVELRAEMARIRPVALTKWGVLR